MTKTAPATIGVDQAESVPPPAGSSETGRGLSMRMLAVFGVRAFGLCLAFAMNVTLARLIGVEGFGLFSFAVSVLMILEVVALFGLDNTLVREVSANRERHDLERVRGLILFGGSAVFLFSLIAAAVTFGFVELAMPPTWPYGATLTIALGALPAAALLVATTAVLEAYRRPLIGQIITAVLRPLFVLGAVTLLAWQGWTITSKTAATLFLLAYSLSFLLAAGYLLRLVTSTVKPGPVTVTARPWLAAAAGFAVTGAALIVTEQTDVLMLAALSDPASVGIYRAASRYAQLVSFALLAAMPPLRPLISAAFARGDRPTQHQACRRVAMIAMTIGLPIALAMTLFGEQLMALYGQAFRQGSTALSILVVGQLLNVAAGPVGVLMTMTGHERKVAVTVTLSALCNIVLNAILIPLYNLEGAAIATAISLAVWNIVMLTWTMKYLRINPSLIGPPLHDR